MSSLIRLFYQTTWEGFKIINHLMKTMIPILIMVKGLEALGFIKILGKILDPFMALVGLPGDMGLVWATAIMTNIYSSIAVFFSLMEAAPETNLLTVAQTTILMSIVLLVHNLPIEQKIIAQTGLKFLPLTGLRISIGFSYGVLLHHFYTRFEWLQTPSSISLLPSHPLLSNRFLTDPLLDHKILDPLINWIIQTTQFLFTMAVVVMVLIYTLKLLEILKINYLLQELLGTLLKPFKIEKKISTIATIGILMGVAYGGGLIVNEVKRKNFNPKDVFLVMVLLSLSHSLIEDTLLVMITGAHLSGILWGRIIFIYLVVFIFSLLLPLLREEKFNRYFSRPRIKKKS